MVSGGGKLFGKKIRCALKPGAPASLPANCVLPNRPAGVHRRRFHLADAARFRHRTGAAHLRRGKIRRRCAKTSEAGPVAAAGLARKPKLGSAGRWPAVFGGPPNTSSNHFCPHRMARKKVGGTRFSAGRRKPHAGRVRSPIPTSEFGINPDVKSISAQGRPLPLMMGSPFDPGANAGTIGSIGLMVPSGLNSILTRQVSRW